VLAEVAVAGPQQNFEVAGPDNQDMIDMARRSLASGGETLRIVPTWDGPGGHGHGRQRAAARRGGPDHPDDLR
jgi:hypothetical protein